jgi:hypothetical protein
MGQWKFHEFELRMQPTDQPHIPLAFVMVKYPPAPPPPGAQWIEYSLKAVAQRKIFAPAGNRTQVACQSQYITEMLHP